MSTVVLSSATLYRSKGPPWEFVPSQKYHALVHETTKNVYAILPGIQYGKPLWIARLVNDSWLTWERQLKATRIEFDNGDVYTFCPDTTG